MVTVTGVDSTTAGLLNYLPAGFDLSSLNFSDPSSRKTEIYVINYVCICLSTIAVLLRLYTRRFVIGTIGVDDMLIVPAVVLACVLSALAIVTALKYNLGKHIWTIPILKISVTAATLTKMLYIIAIIYATCVTFIKCSILAFYWRLSPRRYLRRCTILAFFIVMGIFISSICVTVFQCTPVAGAFNFTIKGRKCLPIVDFYIAQAVLGTLTDVFIYVMPMPLLWQMQLPRRQRIAVIAVLGIGAFVCVAGILRLVAIVTEVGGSIDLTWVMVHTTNWSVLEAHIGIICASIPAIKPLVQKVFPIILGSLRSDHTEGDSPFSSRGSNGKRFGGGIREILRSPPKAMTKLSAMVSWNEKGKERDLATDNSTLVSHVQPFVPLRELHRTESDEQKAMRAVILAASRVPELNVSHISRGSQGSL